MVPRSHRRHGERHVVIRLLLPYIVIIGLGWWFMPASAGFFLGILPPIAWIPLMPVTLWHARKRKELHARIAETGGHMCLECDYDLRELDDKGVCPECGEMFTHEMCVDTWRFYYRDVFRELKHKQTAATNDA